MTRKIEEQSSELLASDDPTELERTPDSFGGGTIIADCLDDEHPTLLGRVRLRWQYAARTTERWCPVLHGLAVRRGDRVLLQWPTNFDEPVVLGVLDGFAKRPENKRGGPSMALATDEELHFTDERGNDVATMRLSPTGPVVRLLTGDARIELDGALSISAREIELRARAGELKLQAQDDIVVRGELIHLN